MDTRISEIQEVFKELFEDKDEGMASSVETVYELATDDSFYKMVVSIQGLETEDISIIHTKFIFKVTLIPRIKI